MPTDCDVVVFGGGIVGCATALSLHRHGFGTVVLERSPHARVGLGEHLAPNARTLLDQLGLLPRFLADGHQRSPGLRVSWGQDDIHEREYIFDPHGDGWNVDRSRFEAMLQTALVSAGGSTLRGVSAHAIVDLNPGWRVEARAGGQVHVFRTRFLVDATGRAASIARRLGAQREVNDRLIGVVGWLAPEPGADLTDATLLIEAVADGWWYAALLPDRRLVAAFMTDAPPRPSRDVWLTRLNETRHIRARASGFALRGNLHASFAGSAISIPAAGPRWMAVGDAAAAFDPLSAMGINRALRSAIHAPYTIRRALAGAAEAATEYVAQLAEEYAAYLTMRDHHYAEERRWPAERFWRVRRNSP